MSHEEYVVYAFFLMPILGLCGYTVARLCMMRARAMDPPVVIPTHSVEYIHSVEPLEIARPIEIYIPQKDPIQTAESLPDDDQNHHILLYI